MHNVVRGSARHAKATQHSSTIRTPDAIVHLASRQDAALHCSNSAVDHEIQHQGDHKRQSNTPVHQPTTIHDDHWQSIQMAALRGVAAAKLAAAAAGITRI
jgi:hypothetical protein